MGLFGRVARGLTHLPENARIFLGCTVYLAGVHSTLLGGIGTLNWLKVKLNATPKHLDKAKYTKALLDSRNSKLGNPQFRLYDDGERITVLTKEGRK